MAAKQTQLRCFDKQAAGILLALVESRSPTCDITVGMRLLFANRLGIRDNNGQASQLTTV